MLQDLYEQMFWNAMAVLVLQASWIATWIFKQENQTENKQMVLLDLNNKISVVYRGSTYVWNSTHNSASALDQHELPKAHCCMTCCSGARIELEVLSLVFSLPSPPLSWSNRLFSPLWLSETIGSSCKVVKPSGTPLKRQHGLQMASISLPHANKAS